MKSQLEIWRNQVSALQLASAFDYVAAARLTTEIARHAEEAGLLCAAKEALPNLLSAANANTKKDRFGASLAQRRFQVVYNALDLLTRPTFGKRRSGKARELGEPPAGAENENRRVLGLPMQGRLQPADIQNAFRRMAKNAHPDRGGNKKAFVELVKARDALFSSDES